MSVEFRITMRQQRSPIWSYFDLFYEGEKKFGSCKICKSCVICSSGSTSGLIFHLKHKHLEVYQDFKQNKPVEIENLGGMNESGQSIESDSSSRIEESDEYFSEKVVLAGEDYGNDLMNVFKELASDEDFTNVTLVTDGGQKIKAHKVVLSAFSPFFKELLLDNVHQHPLLYLRGVKYEFLRAILDFIYLGQAKVEMDQVNQFIELANDLKIKGLRAELAPTKEPTRRNNFENLGTKTSRKATISSVKKCSIKKEISNLSERTCFYACHICDYETETKTDLMSHIEITHTEGIHTCKQCDFYTADNATLKEHEEQSHGR